MLVGALIRRAQTAGGFATVLRKGDQISGAILLQTMLRGNETGLFERIPDLAEGYRLGPCGAQYWGDPQALAQYIERRIRSDSDLWLIELDIADAEQFAALSLC
ncbi:MAG: DUF1491 family protein [Sphingobium sp.]